MIYETSESFRGDSSKAIEFLISTLTGAGFRVESRTDSSLSMSGPGGGNRTRNPLFSACSIDFRITGGSIFAKSELASPKALFAILILAELISVMVIFLMLNNITPHAGHLPIPPAARHIIPFTPIFPLLIILPIIYFVWKTQHQKFMNTLIHNAASVSA
jgi:hypothetical protein